MEKHGSRPGCFTEDIEEDVGSEVEAFARLSRLGNFNQGTDIYNELLSFRTKLFPAAGEYVDLLLEQGAYKTLEQFCESVIEDVRSDRRDFSEAETDLFVLARAYAQVHTTGNLKGSLEIARDFHKRQAEPVQYSSGPYTELQVRPKCR